MQKSGHESSFDQNNQNLSKIATTIGTKNYFLSQQQRNLDQWANHASQIFRYTGEILKTQYTIKSSDVLNSYSTDYENDYARCKKQFDAFCILNRKVQKKQEEIQNLANHLSKKNTKRLFFKGWKQYADKCKNLRRMEQQSDKYQKKRILKNIMKQWLHQTMQSNKIKIKNQVLQKTDIQVSRIQTEYQKIIRTLEETLEKKLSQLSKEEQQHKLLHDKYQAMYSRAPVEQRR